MNRLIIFSLVSMLVSCTSKYSKYHADWIVMEFKINNVDSRDMIGSYNFRINNTTKEADPIGLYLKDEKFMKSDFTKFKWSSKNTQDYITFVEHPFFIGDYEISCINTDCCTVLLKNDSVFIKMYYNSDIPYGRTRKCE